MKRARVAALLLSAMTSPLLAQTVGDLLASAGAALAAGHPLEARATIQRALADYRTRGDAQGEAAALLLLGVTEVRLGNADGARASLEDAIGTLKAQHDTFGAWLGLINLARLERSANRSTSAMAAQDEALAIIDAAKGSDRPLSLAVLQKVGSAFGFDTDVLRLAGAQQHVLTPIFLHYLCEPVTHAGYAGLLIETGQYERAEEHLQAATEAAELFRGAYAFMLDEHYGELRLRQGRFDEARDAFQKALRGSASMPGTAFSDQTLRSPLYKRMAELETAAGNADAALAWNDKAVELARSRAGNQALEAAALSDRGLLLLQLDRLGEAEAAYREARKAAIAIADRSREASIEASLGGLHLFAGSYGTAAMHLERAVCLYQSLNEPANEATLWTILAQLHILTANDETAASLLTHARQLAATSQHPSIEELLTGVEQWQRFRRGHATSAELQEAIDRLASNPRIAIVGPEHDAVRLIRSILAYERGDDASTQFASPAAASFHQSIEARRQYDLGSIGLARRLWEQLFESAGHRELRAGAAAAIGMTWWRERDIASAIEWLSRAADTLEAGMDDLRAETMLSGFLGRERRAYFDVLIEAHLASGQPERAFEVAEKARARAFLRLIGNPRRTAPGVSAANPDLAAELEQLRRAIENDPERSSGESLPVLRRHYEALLARVQSVDPEYASLAAVTPLRLDDVRKHLPADVTLLSYYVSAFGVHAWLLDAHGSEHVRLKLDPAQLRRISCWAEQLGRSRSVRPARIECGIDPARAEEAYAALVGPLRQRITGTRLMVVPHGPLHYVPFAALRDPASARYLVEDYTITYLPSASSLQFLRAKESRVEGVALVLGDPETPSQTRLPGARREAQNVAMKLRTTARVGRNATKSLVYGLRGNVDLLHIAAHATYDVANPLFSAIHFADGALTVDELQSRVDLSGVNLVVLSACSSGVGKRSEGDEIVGLTRSILRAGSPGVISTLWDISDDATPPLIEKFYDRLLGGAAPADALRGAQVELLRDDTYAAPYYWAAFQLTGDPTGRWSQRTASSEEVHP